MIKKFLIAGFILVVMAVISTAHAQIGGGGVDGEESPFADSVWIDEEGGYYAGDNVEDAFIKFAILSSTWKLSFFISDLYKSK